LRSDDNLRANPDARLAIESKEFDQVNQHFLAVKEHETRYQYFTKHFNQEQKITHYGNCTTAPLNFINTPIESLSKYLGYEYNDIYAPLNFLKIEKIGITSQFLEESETYDKMYFSNEWSKYIIQLALNKLDVQYITPTIFDLGCGSGNSIFACCELFPECTILATDLSYNLLKIAMNHKKKNYPSSQVYFVAMDGLNVSLIPSSFDIFIGQSILHHLIDITTVFHVAYSSIKPNGCAIFFEPMLSGFVVMTSLFRTLLKINGSIYNESEKLNEKIVTFINALINDYTLRGNAYSKMEHSRITDLDDKWLFTLEHLRTAATDAGFKNIEIVSLFNPPRYKSQISGLLRFVEVNFNELPHWVKEIVNIFDESDISCNKNDIFMEVGIICKK